MHKSSSFWMILFILCSNLLPAQEDSLQRLTTAIDSNLLSPRSAVVTHLIWLQEITYNPAKSATALFQEGRDEETLKQLAIQLKAIFDGKGYYIDETEVPDDPFYKDSLTGRHRYVVVPKLKQIYLVKLNGQWVYSRETLNAIPRLYRNTYPLNSELFLSITPNIAHKPFLGLEVWQYQAILIIALCSAFLFVILRFFAGWLIRKAIPLLANQAKVNANDIRPIARPFGYLLLFALLIWISPVLRLPIDVAQYVYWALRILVSVFGLIAIYRLVDLMALVFLNLAGRTETTMDDQLIPLVHRVVKLVVAVLGVLFILQNFNVNVTALLAGISIGGLAIALAAQDTVKNFLGSVTIFADKPFQVGDFIETEKAKGTILEVGVRSTMIRALDGATISIPNGELSNLPIVNHGTRSYRRYDTVLSITYDTPPEKIVAFIEQLRIMVASHPRTRDEGNLVYFHEMGAFSLNIFFAVYFELTNYAEMLMVRQEVFLEVLKLAEEIGVKFAFPTTSVYLENTVKQ